MRDADVVVVGGGIVGLCSALALQRSGQHVLLLDPGRPEAAASFGNAGHIAIEQVEPIASLATLRSALRRLTIFDGPLGLPPAQIRHWAPFALRLARSATPRCFARGKQALSGLLSEAMPAWSRLAATLPETDLIRERGHIVTWFDREAARRGLAAWQAADTGTARFRRATQDDYAALRHLTARTPAGAIVFTNTGQVADPGAMLQALWQAFVAAGGQVRRDQVRGLSPDRQGVTLAVESGDTITAPRLLVAAGVHSGRLLSAIGLNVPIVAERGYHVQAASHRWPEGLPPVVFEEHSTIATRFSGGLRLASFVEFTGIDTPPDPRRWATLERRARRLNLPVDGPFTRWSGARPTLPDYLPAIGRARSLPNLFYAFGHQHLGLTLGPLTGEIVAALVLGQAQAVDLRPFDLIRFSAAP